MAYVSLLSLHNPATGTSPPATYGDQIHDNFEYLRLRGPVIVTSATRPGSPSEGDHIYETDTDLFYVYSGSAWVQIGNLAGWTSYTPTVKFGATAASINNDSRYWRSGRFIIANFGFRITNFNGGTGTLTITRPVAGRMNTNTNNYLDTLGDAGIIDVSSGNSYHRHISANSADGSDIVLRSGADPGVVVTHAVPFALAAGASATGDEIYGTIIYTAAS